MLPAFSMGPTPHRRPTWSLHHKLEIKKNGQLSMKAETGEASGIRGEPIEHKDGGMGVDGDMEVASI